MLCPVLAALEAGGAHQVSNTWLESTSFQILKEFG
jgi:hypothetical protein